MTVTLLVLHPCSFSWGGMVSVSFISFDKYELQIRKKSTFFSHSFAQKNWVWKKIDVILRLKCSLWNVCAIYETMDSFRLFDENVAEDDTQLLAKTWCSYLFWVLRNLRHKFEKLAHVTKSSKKNVTIWAPRKARAQKRNIAKLTTEKFIHYSQ